MTIAGWVALVVCSVSFLMLGVSLGTPSKKEMPKTPTYICSCTHAWGMHGEDGCEEEVIRQLWDRSNTKAGKEYVQCACRRYAGEEPPQAFGLNQSFTNL